MLWLVLALLSTGLAVVPVAPPQHCYDHTRSTATEISDYCGSAYPATIYPGKHGTPFCGPAGCGFDDPGMIATDSFPYLGAEFTITVWYIRYQTDNQDAQIFSFVNKNTNEDKLSIEYRPGSSSSRMRARCNGVAVSPS